MGEHGIRSGQYGCADTNAGLSTHGDTAARQIRVAICSDTRLYRDSLALSLGRVEHLMVVGRVESSISAMACVAETRPDVVLLDGATPERLTLPRLVAAAGIPVKIVAFSITESEEEICDCAEAGVAGYISRNGSTEDLIAAIENAVRGEVVCSPRVAASLFRRLAMLAHDSGLSTPAATLTGREREIVALIDRGFSNKEIARQLRICTTTVKNHIHNILEKLSVRRRGEAAALLRGAVPTALQSPMRSSTAAQPIATA